jgi:3-oxoacyl-[acyl-carrier protein] reductase
MDLVNPGAERVAVVVGAGGELGRATAQALATAGYAVVGVDRNEQGLKELPDGIRREVGDASDPAVAKSLIDRIAAEVGSPEVLINTIGMFRLGEAVAATPEDLKVLMDVNLGSALWLSQAVEPYMRQRGKGSIVHVSARPATDPTAGLAAYSLSKAALSHLIRILDWSCARTASGSTRSRRSSSTRPPTGPRSPPDCWPMPSSRRRSRTSSPSSPVTSPLRSAGRSSRPTAPDPRWHFPSPDRTNGRGGR